MQPRPIAETIGPPRPSFRCFILVEIRLSVLSRPRNRQATALQNCSIPRCEDGEIQVSMHATFVAGNLLRGAAHRLCRQAKGDRDGEDARESGGSVRCVTGTRSSWPDRLSERRDIRFWPRVHEGSSRSFAFDGPDVERFFLRSPRQFWTISRSPSQDKSFPP